MANEWDQTRRAKKEGRFFYAVKATKDLRDFSEGFPNQSKSNTSRRGREWTGGRMAEAGQYLVVFQERGEPNGLHKANIEPIRPATILPKSR